MADLHSAIMNLPCKRQDDQFASVADRLLYKDGHRDARHAAAELANETIAAKDARIAELERQLAQHRDVHAAATSILVGIEGGYIVRNEATLDPDDFDREVEELREALRVVDEDEQPVVVCPHCYMPHDGAAAEHEDARVAELKRQNNMLMAGWRPRILACPLDNDGLPLPITRDEVVTAACHAVGLAAAAHMVLTVYQRPHKPLAMGNYSTEIEVRPARVRAEAPC